MLSHTISLLSHTHIACTHIHTHMHNISLTHTLTHYAHPPTISLYLPQTLSYNRLPSSRNEDGLVTLQFSKPHSVLISEQEILTRELQAIVNAATVQVVVETVRPLPDNWLVDTVYIQVRWNLSNVDTSWAEESVLLVRCPYYRG